MKASTLKTKMNFNNVLKEGTFTNNYFKGRFDKNKNILTATTGATGSGKSYADLRIAELWYKERFNKPFPIDNVSFSNSETMKLISSGKLEKGELIILEESGVSLGSLDFQQKTSKMFVYILQSFRSMNIGLLMNLPVLTMLNKSARQLLHIHFVTCSINPINNTCKLKPYVHQLNQSSGKSYWKFPRALVNKRRITLERINFNLPSIELRTAYEKKKSKYLIDMTTEYSKEYDKIEYDKIKSMARNDLTEKQMIVFNMLKEGLKVKEIAEKRGTSVTSVYEIIENIEKKGFKVEKVKNSLENRGFQANSPIPVPF